MSKNRNRAENVAAKNKRDLLALLKLLLPVVGVTAIGIYFHHFVWDAIKESLAINLGIIIVAAYGVLLILNRLIGAIGDFRVIERFGEEAARGVHMKSLLEQPWLKRHYVRHYLSHIAETGGTLSSQMRQTAIENELLALREEYESRQELPHFLVGFMVAMGLLGTFIGLLETLTGISSMLDGMGKNGADVQSQFMELVAKLRAPLAGMGIAFSASMFGLIASLMLAIMMTNLRRYVSHVLALARNVMHDLIEVTGGDPEHKSLSPEEIVRMSVSGGGGGNAVGGTMLAGRIDLLVQKIDCLLDEVGKGIAVTQQTNNLLGFGPRMKEATEKSLGEMQLLVQRQEQLTKIQHESLAVQRASAASNKEITEKTLGEMQLLAQRQEQLTKIQNESLAVLCTSAASNKEITEKTLGEMQLLAQRQEQLTKIQNESLVVLRASAATSKETAEKMAMSEPMVLNSINLLLEAQSRNEQATISGAKHLYEIKDQLVKLSGGTRLLEHMASGSAGQTMLLESLVEEVRATNRVLSSATAQQPVNDDFIP